jgi:hypothetical protein
MAIENRVNSEKLTKETMQRLVEFKHKHENIPLGDQSSEANKQAMNLNDYTEKFKKLYPTLDKKYKI